MPVKVSLIVAHDDHRGIGAKNRLLWNIKKDLDHFRRTTLGHPIIMGRKTHESIGRVLPGRPNIIITRDQNLKIPGCFVVQSIKAALDLAKTKDDQELFIIGGAEIYRQALEHNLVDRLYVTKVAGDFKADVFFPDYSEFTQEISKEEFQEDQYKFATYVLEKH